MERDPTGLQPDPAMTGKGESADVRNSIASLNGPVMTISQSRAVETPGPLIVLAGPGSGKTHVAAMRIARLSGRLGPAPFGGTSKGKIKPGIICALTFSVRAASELRERVKGQGIGENCEIGTVHSMAFRIISLFAPADSPLRYGPCDGAVIKCLAREATKSSTPSGPFGPGDADRLLLALTLFRNEAPLDRERSLAAEDFHRLLDSRGLFDFDDLIRAALDLVANDRSASAWVEDRFTAFIVDEFQDLTPLQYRFVKTICEKGGSDICAIGDPDQSIYGFRGADPEVFDRFKSDFPTCGTVRLSDSFRCSPGILAAARSVLSSPFEKPEYATENTGSLPGFESEGRTVFTLGTPSRRQADTAAAGAVSCLIEGLALTGTGGPELPQLSGWESSESFTGLADIAIMARNRGSLRGVARSLDEAGIPWEGSIEDDPLDTPGVRDILGVLAEAAQILTPDPGGAKFLDTLALRGLEGADGIGPSMIETVKTTAVSESISIMKAADRLATSSHLKSERRKSLALHLQRVTDIANQAGKVELSILMREIAGSFCRETVDFDRDIGLLRISARSMGRNPASETIESFLKEILASPGLDQNGFAADRVRLLTIHASKGLEFHRVVITGLEKGQFPSERDGSDPAEEERLMYVAMTRARHGVLLLHPASEIETSEFIGVIPKELYRVLDNSGIIGKFHRRREWAEKQRVRKAQLSLFG